MIASTVISGASQLYQADAAANAAEYNAQLNDQNAKLALRRADDALERGQAEEEKAKRQSTLNREAQEASFTAANLDTGYGSPLDVIIATTTAGEMEAATVRANAEREAEDFEAESVNFRNAAQMNRFEAKNAKRGGMDGGAGILKYNAMYG
jgi:hypothetical protein